MNNRDKTQKHKIKKKSFEIKHFIKEDVWENTSKISLICINRLHNYIFCWSQESIHEWLVRENESSSWKIRKFTRMDFICALHLKYNFNRQILSQHYTLNIKTYSCLNPPNCGIFVDSLAFSILKLIKSSSFWIKEDFTLQRSNFIIHVCS